MPQHVVEEPQVPNRMEEDADTMIHHHFATLLQQEIGVVESAYNEVARNVRTVLRRQYNNRRASNANEKKQPLCEFVGEDRLARTLGTFPPTHALFTLARIYDEAHITLCQGRSAARRGKPHDAAFKESPRVDLHTLTDGLDTDKGLINDQILLERNTCPGKPYRAVWRRMPVMDFDSLQSIPSLSGLLPGESEPSQIYAGIGGGGGSDIISASLLGHLLRCHGKEMNVLVSTRTWATGSQGQKGSRMGIKREIYDHGGHVEVDGHPVPGTFKVTAETSSEGRPLEAIPVQHHSQVYMVLDQGESKSEVPEDERAELKDQLRAVLTDSGQPIQTVAIVDTGGDVFGADAGRTSTPDQDLRVQQAMTDMVHGNLNDYNLVTAVIAPGVDAPDDAPQKALQSGGVVYRPTAREKAMLLKLIAEDYKMDGKVPGRFGKTTMALQARLRGESGWVSLDLPEHIVDTWENPWSSFVYIRKCMSDIILMPTTKLLPLIESKPEVQQG
ncbi:uncharacterized protein HMPREF1541_10216 [Cyphellophora europaea CBS 101466]|uniref:Uncharacterized protein n=1 Tax=Cyphellophora europaea (strain CBS 101466) TaxID=1220924 RepID=W2S759_CYPE1|nr:uncharacterized protein HMPREF1541_10216 [Cyphellophora europaea CBS 101466]ETN44546.1 hypothetical protein HMPREF1541_10216 [Cyphellophora europaea CBS 101466]